MKVIATKNKKKKDTKKLKKYWTLVYPSWYANKLVANEEYTITKIAKKELDNVELKGKLKQTKDGFTYADISNNVIHGLFTLINNDNKEKPPYFGRDGIGAHISIISDEEITEDIKIEELGEEISFTLGSVYSTKPEGWDEMKRVWFVSVDSPEIKKLRKKYKLPETYKDKGHDFHITIAVERA
jgi:hypothetical protein